MRTSAGGSERRRRQRELCAPRFCVCTMLIVVCVGLCIRMRAARAMAAAAIPVRGGVSAAARGVQYAV